MSFKMAELDRFPGHRMEDGGARKRRGILRSTQCVCVCVCVCVGVGVGVWVCVGVGGQSSMVHGEKREGGGGERVELPDSLMYEAVLQSAGFN